jgi:hypothetical protein
VRAHSRGFIVFGSAYARPTTGDVGGETVLLQVAGDSARRVVRRDRDLAAGLVRRDDDLAAVRCRPGRERRGDFGGRERVLNPSDYLVMLALSSIARKAETMESLPRVGISALSSMYIGSLSRSVGTAVGPTDPSASAFVRSGSCSRVRDLLVCAPRSISAAATRSSEGLSGRLCTLDAFDLDRGRDQPTREVCLSHADSNWIKP